MQQDSPNDWCRDIILQAADPLLHPDFPELLHRETHFIEHFHELITQSIRPPYALSIDGSWGAGKTTVMKLLQEKLEPDYSTFWFNPWEYQSAESIVLAFLQRFAASQSAEKVVAKTTLKILGFIGYVSLDTAFASLPSALLNVYNKLKDLGELKGKYKELESLFSTPAKLYENYSDLIDLVQRDFKNLAKGISENNSNRPIILFFDDLDRCLPDKTIEILEAIKNLFVVQGAPVIFICGIDTHVAKQFIIQRYHNIEADFAVNYFRKIFNLTIRMPFRPEHLQRFLCEHLQNPHEEGENASAALLADFIKDLGLFAGLTSLRKYLSIIDNLLVYQIFNQADPFQPTTPTDFKEKNETLLIILLVFQQAWPLLYTDFIKEGLKDDQKSVLEIAELFTKPSDSNERDPLTAIQKKFFSNYLSNEEYCFYSDSLNHWLQSNPAF